MTSAAAFGTIRRMIDHTGYNVSDPAKSRAFYEAALAPLGYAVLMEIPVEHTGGRVVVPRVPAEGSVGDDGRNLRR